jgi:hypothetical protein
MIKIRSPKTKRQCKVKLAASEFPFAASGVPDTVPARHACDCDGSLSLSTAATPGPGELVVLHTHPPPPRSDLIARGEIRLP